MAYTINYFAVFIPFGQIMPCGHGDGDNTSIFNGFVLIAVLGFNFVSIMIVPSDVNEFVNSQERTVAVSSFKWYAI